MCLDKTPAYALVLPFIRQVFPEARVIVLTRHPLATLASYAHSFFDSNYEAALRYNPIVQRYVPALAAAIREGAEPILHVRYEDLVSNPQTVMAKVYAHAGVPYEAGTIEYGRESKRDASEGLGDPIGVRKHTRPDTASIDKWTRDALADERVLAIMQETVNALAPEDLAACGYPLSKLWNPLERAKQQLAGQPPKRPHEPLTQYRLQRKAIVRMRAWVQRGGLFKRAVELVRRAAHAALDDIPY